MEGNCKSSSENKPVEGKLRQVDHRQVKFFHFLTESLRFLNFEPRTENIILQEVISMDCQDRLLIFAENMLRNISKKYS